MPRIAAVLASLMLAGSAIGINIARYPVVWKMVARPEATNSEFAKNGAASGGFTPESTDEQAAARAADASGDRSRARASSGQAAGLATDPAAYSRGAFTPQTQQPASGAQAEPQGRILAVRPLTPSGGTGQLTGYTPEPVNEDEVRRLPPIDPRIPAVESPASASDGDSAPNYPSTRTP